MIGTALSEKEQFNLLKKLDMCDVPWNCAHGRVSLDVTLESLIVVAHNTLHCYLSSLWQPTMSHIRNLTNCLINDDDALALHVAGPNLSIVSED